MAAAIAGAVIALVLLPFTPPGVPVIAASLGVLAGTGLGLALLALIWVADRRG